MSEEKAWAAPPESPGSVATVTATSGSVLSSTLRTEIFIVAASAIACFSGKEASVISTL